MTRATRRWLLLGAAGAAIATIVGVAAAASSKPTETMKPGVRMPPQFIQGHSYRLRITGDAVKTIDAAAINVADLQQQLDAFAPNTVKVKSATVSGTTFSLNYDYIGPTQTTKIIPQTMLDEVTKRGVTLTIADLGVTGLVGGPSNASDIDVTWHAWRQNDSDPNDNGTDVYVGPNENYAATAAAYWANRGYRAGYYGT